ncbi:MAG: HAD family hydrolase [Rhodopirellula sp.]|nr:HAD family hydrolase [Rhodopirellula sp.]
MMTARAGAPRHDADQWASPHRLQFRRCPAGSLSRPIRGLLFDMGDVLHDTTLWRRWLLQLLGRLGLRTNYRSFYHVWDRDFLADVHRGRREFCEAFQAFLLSVGLTPAQIDEVQAACQARRRQWEDTARALPGVKPTLARLQSAGYVLGVLSDSEHPSDALSRQLDRFGIGGFFSTVVSSIDLGETKPHPIGYRTALERMKILPEQAAFVGHDTLELSGATGAGLQTIAFNFDPDAKADVFIARFDELLDVTAAARAHLAAAG